MTPKYAMIKCGSNDEYGEFPNCVAFVSEEGLREAHDLIQDIKNQRPESTVLQGQSQFTFPDSPDDLVEIGGYEIIGKPVQSGKDFLDETVYLVEEYKVTNEASEQNVYHSDLIISPSNEGGDSFDFYYRMEIKHCSTIVKTNIIHETELVDILEAWDIEVEQEEIVTEKILKDNDDEAAWNH